MKTINLLFLIAIVVLGAAGLAAYVQLSPTNELILHFTTAGQPDYTGSQVEVLNAVVTGGVVVLLNYLLSRSLKRREGFFALGLSITSLIIALLLFTAVFVIIVNNQ
jgi:hypothetical protein